MKKIHSIDVHSLHQEEALNYHLLVCAAIEKNSNPKFASKLQVYRDKVNQFNAQLKPASASVHTAELNLLDQRRDDAYTRLAARIRQEMKHFNADKATLAQQLNVIVRKYPNPTAYPFGEESGILQSLLQDMATDDAKNALAALNIADWLEELKAATEAFTQVFTLRANERSTIEVGATKQARKATDEAYKNCVDYINALIIIEDSDTDYINVVNAVNEYVDYENTLLAARHTRNANNNNKKKEEAAVK